MTTIKKEKTEYKTIKIPVILIDELDKKLNNTYNTFSSRLEFIKSSIREKMREL